ncbi:MAG: undecaprenyldiphospho-muramoylpentapeptide beta-N-acetylglucosaminyltransferase [Succinivibrionaceae bacterium]|nr:undecaprenyldiphospho-muramoylpentapeptide beta-N-acetylglucosaminyltransferase [Succinivibrionaceae bacterium]
MKKILVMAGGTGGHIFPGLSVASELSKNKEFEVLWLGAKNRMEATLVPKHGFNIEYVNVSGLRRFGILHKINSLFKMGIAVFRAIGIIRKFKPDVVLGLGGFASAPGGIAAKICGVPLIIHEQNAVAGLTNKILFKLASKILLGFPGSFSGEKVLYVGNPVREEVIDLNKSLPKYFRDDELKILVVGGSLGAQALNENLPMALKKSLDAYPGIKITHQTGKGNAEKVLESYKDLGISGFVDVKEFIFDMAKAYKEHDLIICRSGALTVAEVEAAGIPAIFVPLPTAVDDHQTKNAKFLADAGASIILPQSSLTPDSLALEIVSLAKDRRKLEKMSENTAQLAKLDATKKVADICRFYAGDQK